jgi:hypothetical protein
LNELSIQSFNYPSLILFSEHTFTLLCRYPFKPHQNKNEHGYDFDDEEEFIDMLDDVEKEAIEIEQTYDNSESCDNKELNEDTELTSTSTNDIASPDLLSDSQGEDEFISDDEDSNNTSSVSIQEINIGNKPIYDILHQTNSILIQRRKLVKIMRSVGIIDQYVRNHQNGPKNCLPLICG